MLMLLPLSSFELLPPMPPLPPPAAAIFRQLMSVTARLMLLAADGYIVTLISYRILLPFRRRAPA